MKKKKGRLGLSNSFHYTLMVLPGYIWLFMFSIVPMVGIVMAFQDYNPSKGWFGSPWVGLKWFKYLTVIPDAKRALVNTLIIAIAKVILNIIIPLVFALLLNEVKNMKFKRRFRRSYICRTSYPGLSLQTSSPISLAQTEFSTRSAAQWVQRIPFFR